MSDTHLSPGHPDWGWEFAAEEFVFARLREERVAARDLPAGEREAALGRIEALWGIACWHSVYVHADGKSWARCFTCDPSCGSPCTTMCLLACMWRGHEEFRPFWGRPHTDFIADVFEHGGFRRAYEKAHPRAGGEERSDG